MSLEEYKERIQKYGELKQIPIEALPYMIAPSKQTSGFWGELGSSISRAGNTAWDGVSYLGQSAWDGITWTGNQVSDFASWATGYGNNPDKAIEEGANQAESASDVSQLPGVKTGIKASPQYVDPEAAANAAEQQGVWDTVGNVASKVGSTFADLVGKVGVPLGTTWLTMKMKEDMVEDRMEERRESRQEARQRASENLEEEKKKRINQTVAYIESKKQKLQQLGYNIQGNHQLKNRMALEILKKTGGRVPSMNTPITKFFAQGNNNQIAVTGGGIGGGNIMSWLKTNWWVPVGAIGAIILLLGIKEQK